MSEVSGLYKAEGNCLPENTVSICPSKQIACHDGAKNTDFLCDNMYKEEIRQAVSS